MRVVLTFLLMLATATVWADWVKLSESEDIVYYLDPATIRQVGNLRRAWVLGDYKARNQKGELSVRFLSDYDCEAERFRILSIRTHSEAMGAGRILISQEGSDLSGKWLYNDPNTPREDMFKSVCK